MHVFDDKTHSAIYEATVVLLGTAHLKNEDPTSAIEYTALLSSSPDRENTWNHANCLRSLGRHEEAASYFIAKAPRLKGNLPVANDSCEVGHVGTVCMVKWGVKYGASYVNRLASALLRHAGGVRVVCFTDDESGVDSGVECFGLPKGRFKGWQGWWYKSYLFSPEAAVVLRGGTGEEWAAYVDLDTVVLSKPRWEPEAGAREFNALRTDEMVNECRRPDGINSSVMVWRVGGSASKVYELLGPDVHKGICKFDHWLELLFPERGYVECAEEYRAVEEGGGPGEGTKALVTFPLRPKPHECDVEWVKKAWIGDEER